ncbi:hypothetical protein HPB47_011424 [Ixodes persulcatus]|uniref:Uncharacterized protein n=1 Tax=Ixodes persulcatus TaxID=34615 RepID=A0AC60NWD4_IXOPE|nr:hypothetical protein HPB47_011424 [Ixodes persulcatus]
MYWILRHMKRPTRVCPGYWFVPELIVVRFWMDTHLSMAARFFNFLEASMATHGDDDLVAFFHGPQAVVVTVTPAAVEGLVNSSNNVSKPFPYHFMEPVMGTGLIIRICDGFISRICNVVYWWDILYEFSREGKNYHNISQIMRDYCRQGFDTTATAAAFCLYLLGNHLEVQEKVHEELERVFADDFDRPVTLDDLRDLPYLDCVIKVKGSIACQDISFKLADVEALDPAALQQVFPEKWSSYAHRAVKVEERMWADGGLADITMDRLIIKTGEDGSTDNSDDEDMGCKALVEWWLNHRTECFGSSDYVRKFSGVVEDDKVYQLYWAGDARTKGGFYDAKVLYMAGFWSKVLEQSFALELGVYGLPKSTRRTAPTHTLFPFRPPGNWWNRSSGLLTGLLVQPTALQVVLGIAQRECGESLRLYDTRVSECHRFALFRAVAEPMLEVNELPGRN